MASDLKTHPDTDNPSLNGLAMIGMMYVTDGDKAAVALDRTFSMTEARVSGLSPAAGRVHKIEIGKQIGHVRRK
jgi:hypothetical protein